MHQSVSASDASACTRTWVEWANAMFVVLYDDTFRERCDGAAEAGRLEGIRVREGGDGGGGGGGVVDPLLMSA